MSKQDFLKTQTCVLRVNMQCDCDGCRNKVKKLLLKVDGVYTVNIDAKQGKVTVVGNADPALLIKKLEKSGKHAELWGAPQKSNQVNLTSQYFRNIQIDTAAGKGTGHNKEMMMNNKSYNGGGGGKDHHGHHMMKRFNEQKSSHGNLNSVPPHADHTNYDDDDVDVDDDDVFDDDDYDEGDGQFGDDDDDDDDDDDYDDDEGEEDEEDDFDHVFVHHPHPTKINIPIMANSGPKNKGQGNKPGQDKKGGVAGCGNAKKGGGFNLPAIWKVIAKNADCKKGARYVSSGGNHRGGSKNRGGGKGGRDDMNSGKKKSDNDGGGGGGGGSGNNKNGGANNGGKKGGGGKNENKQEGSGQINVPHEKAKSNGSNVGQMGNYPMGPIGPTGHHNIPPAHGLPTTGMMPGGQGMGPAAFGNPYNQQQYMAMLVNQQRQQQRMNGADGIYHPTMHVWAPPYMPPPPPVYGPYTHMFSDENAGGCSVM